MKKSIVVIVSMIILFCLITATIVSAKRARDLANAPQTPSSEGEEPTQSVTEGETEGEPEQDPEGTTEEQTQPPQEQIGITYVEYTKEAHPGTGIAYRGSGENADLVIVIDAGHQMHAMDQTEPDGPGSSTEKPMASGGTQGSVTGLAEYELNLRVALALRDLLVEKGYTVVMVREVNDVEISNAERAQLANRAGAHVNLRIHANGDADASAKGAMTVCQSSANPYHAALYENSRALSDAVLAAFCQSTGMEQRIVWETDTMTGTNWSSVPTTIIEMGFMTNAEDEAAMAAEDFAAKAADGLAKGVENYLSQYPPKEETTDGEQTAPDGEYDIDYERERELGQTFTDVYMTVEATAVVWVRTEPSTQGGDSTKVHHIETYAGKRMICIGFGENWHRVLIDGKVYYVSAAYLRVVTE